MTLLKHVALIAAIALASTTAARAEWQKHEYQTDGFSIEFSGPVTVKQTGISSDALSKMVRSTSYLQDGGGTLAYVMAASLFKDDTAFDFDAGVKGTVDTYKCAVTERDNSSTTDGVRTREIHASKCVDGTIRVGARFVMAGKWFYQVVYLIAPNESVADAEHFLQSFKLTPH